MNERIEQLAEQAKFMAEEDINRQISYNTELKAFAEKFAELIVNECGLWFNNRLVVEPDYGIEHRIERNRAVVGVMKEFNQHFGVEE